MTLESTPRWEALGRPLLPRGRPAVMGILNVTPDSFSDGGRASTLAEALANAARMIEEGADVLDIGGESTRPGSSPISIDEELRRVIPVVEALAAAGSVPISVDTTKAEVARRALGAGAAVLNDITALRGDPEMLEVAASRPAGVVLMHMAGTPRTMQDDPRYGDATAEIRDFLAGAIARAEAAGIARSRIAIDPGIGFGKTLAHNLELLRKLGQFANLGCAVLVGTSRKGFLGTLTGRPIGERAFASVASALAAVARGANVVRVHDVGPTVDALKVWCAVDARDDRS